MREKFLNINDDLKKTIAGWFFFNSALGTIIASFLSISLKNPFIENFFSSQITTHIISSLSILTARIIPDALRKKHAIVSTAVIVTGTLVASTFGLWISSQVLALFQNTFLLPSGDKIKNYFSTFILPVLILTATITMIGVFIQRLKDSKVRLEKDILEIQGNITEYDSKNQEGSGLAFKEGGLVKVVEYREIIYLSSSGKRTIIHTDKNDYETAQLFKEIEKKLPANVFIRIHKQYIVNLRYIGRLRYFMGGRYIVYLADEDESNLPVGRTYTAVLKEKLKDTLEEKKN